MTLMMFIIATIIVGAALYLLRFIPIDETFKAIVRVILIVVFVIYAIIFLFGLAGLNNTLTR